jgi:hypothetical protein
MVVRTCLPRHEHRRKPKPFLPLPLAAIELFYAWFSFAYVMRTHCAGKKIPVIPTPQGTQVARLPKPKKWVNSAFLQRTDTIDIPPYLEIKLTLKPKLAVENFLNSR